MYMSAITVAALAGACFDTSGLGGGEGDNGDGGGAGDGNVSGGDGAVGDAGCTTFEGVCNGNRVVDVSGGQGFGCALLASGSVWCWGNDQYGQVGQSPSSTFFPPTKIVSLQGVTAIRSGVDFTCALKSDQTVWCWGRNLDGQLGHDPSGDPICTNNLPCQSTPIAVANLAFVTAISADYENACAITTAGSVICWGSNAESQLGFIGDGGFVPGATLVTHTNATNGTPANGVGSTCFVVPASSQILCLGANFDNTLGHSPNTYGDVDAGLGYPLNPAAEPVTGDSDAAISGFSQVCCGAEHCCAIKGGQAACWGVISGPNTATYVQDPPTHLVSGSEGATAVTCGSFHTCILQGSTNDVACWGNNYQYAVGTGVPEGGGYGTVQNPTPIDLQAVIVRGGYAQTLAVGTDGGVWQWGGGGAFADAAVQPTPRRIEGLP